MEPSTIAVVIIAIVNFFGGVLIKILWSSITDLRDDNKAIRGDGKALSEDLHELAKLVAGDYVKRSEFEKGFDKIYAKLDEVDAKIMTRFDGLFEEVKKKVDKSECHERSLGPDRRAC